MAFSAAELQKRHGLEGAPDPFPTLGDNPAPAPSTTAQRLNSNNGPSGSSVDTSSEDAFPSLGASAAPATNITKPAISAWASKPTAVKATGGKAKGAAASSGGLGRIGTPTATSHPFSDTFSIPAADLVQGKTAQETISKVREQTGVIVESSTQMRTGLKTFLLRGADQKKLVVARRLIERGLSKPVTIEVAVPITTLGTIIGPKGSTLKGITDSTQVKIDIPRRDTLPAYDPKDAKSDAGSDESDNEDDEPQVPISITGPSAACNDAKNKILALISHKTSQTSTSIKTIPSSYYPFISGPKGVKVKQLEEEIGQGEIKIHVPPPAVWKALEKQSQGDLDENEAIPKDRDLSIKVKGEKEKVKLAVQEILKQYEILNDSLRELKISIPKRQHRFLVGSSADDILDQTGCIVELPPVDDPSDQCVIKGPQPSLIPALTLVMDKANAIAVEMVDIVTLHRPNTSDPLAHAKKVLRYLLRTSKLRSIADSHSGVKIFPPFASAVANTGSVVIEIVGENKGEVTKAKDEVAQIVKSVLPAGTTSVEVDHLIHSLLIGKKGSKIAQFEQAHNVTTVFPPAQEESSDVTLIYTEPLDSLPTEKKARDAKLKEILAGASKAIAELAKDAADIKTETLDIEKKWHRYIIGTGGTVLNALIGEDQLVNVKVGSNSSSKSASASKEKESEDVVVVRGPSGEVDRVVKQIQQIVEDAKNDDIINGHTVEFNVLKQYVPHLVGTSGATINKLRETLGVKVNFDDDENAAKKVSKKPVVHCKIVGRKEAVEEAKKRLDAQIEKLEDETTEIVHIKRAIQPALIGSGGKYAIRLEEKYGVKLSFPRDNKEGQKPDEVVIRGGKKGVAQAKAELLEAAEYENESRQSISFTIPTKSISQIVGKAGATINKIKDDTNTQIDIEKTPSESDKTKTEVTVRGDKASIASAKKAILEIVEEIGDEIEDSLEIDQKYHRTLIGQGGNKLRETISNATGGSLEGYKQAGLVTFPKSGDSDLNTVKFRGDSKIVKKIKAELEKQVATLKETVVIGVVVPQSQHASKIGRGGSALQDLQRRTGAVVHFPGSRQYSSVGEIENASELGDAPEGDIVKVIGTKEVAAKAAEQLQIVNERPARTDSRQGRSTPGNDYPSKSISIPTKYYHAIADQQNLIRQIRGVGAFITIPTAPPKPASAKPSATSATNGNGNGLAAKTARIDLGAEDDIADDVEGDFELVENYQNAPEGEQEWSVRAKEEADLEKAVKVLEEAVERAKAATHVGLLTGLPRSAFPRIIGSKGSTISRIRAETGADVQVSKDDDLITITGDETSVLQAKDSILSIVSRPQRGDRY
ncbi:uncharacterized protein I303_107172 [Kwoniella dejecticola CBS 10117]|uniref:K Homology domain-containing protein n=1 Tax=Kwoniella dejecticola CBS 10117 TaxID=1296121 RepID=A0A1A5ZYZ9_9TREE|nr:uncharacterized protein I303_06574 [Kwoniella dejecticola CBS 10117]OBR83015.1 hypothetical protein I303_06574 [Kwoniella dejecticola CBS 10117]